MKNSLRCKTYSKVIPLKALFLVLVRPEQEGMYCSCTYWSWSWFVWDCGCTCVYCMCVCTGMFLNYHSLCVHDTLACEHKTRRRVLTNVILTVQYCGWLVLRKCCIVFLGSQRSFVNKMWKTLKAQYISRMITWRMSHTCSCIHQILTFCWPWIQYLKMKNVDKLWQILSSLA